ncbi:hypothetical protein [Mesorhizobium sp. DCY119]|uniref:hypothetical protein n=2 Tax=Mesorhizobium sp. DCY119 TaxID=2108445 RepID=UPI000E75A1CD|nr:hypothetical protein [Mesorhizobium sp. DCY119]RJG46569.1 hypothetical protein D3Y55_21495 [Mesorhizobium sp. DCY119]
MKAYFVRIAADQQVVGLFVAPSLSMLAALVDECVDPNECEYAPARMGGIMVAGKAHATWPLTDAADEEVGQYENPTGIEGSVLSQQWEDDLRYVPAALEWKPLAQEAGALTKAKLASKSHGK